MTEKLTMPDGLEDIGDMYSNFDHILQNGAEEAVQEGDKYFTHPAWNHYGYVWFADGMFHEMVKQRGTHVATISDESLKQVLAEVNDTYGDG